MPLVSVIIPTYNRAQLVRRAVDSALAQAPVQLEVLVVDDGSTDGTREAIESAYGSDPRVRYLPKNNGGVSSARNLALREARGDFIAFLDADDVWLPGKLGLQLAALERLPDAGMVWTDMAAVDVTGQVLHPRYLRKMYSTYSHFPTARDLFSVEPSSYQYAQLDGVDLYSGDIFSPMVLGSLVHTSSVLIRRERQTQVGLFNESIRTGEDYPFHLQTCRLGKVAYLDTVTLHYTIGEDDALTAPRHLLQASIHFLATLKNSMSQDAARIRLPQRMLQTRLAQAYAWAGQTHLEAGLHTQARMFLVQSLLKRPFNLDAIKGLVKSFLSRWR